MLAARVALLAAAACASGSGDDAALADYFSIARTIWPPTTSAGRCLRVQEAEGWAAKGASSSFKTAGVEGVGHHWLEGLDRSLCGGKRCGGQQSFSACGGCCKVSTTKDAVAYAKAPQRARRGHAWRCFSSDHPNYPKLSKTRHHVVLVRDVLATHESILRRFWKWDARPGGGVDTLAREETALGKAMAKLEGLLHLRRKRPGGGERVLEVRQAVAHGAGIRLRHGGQVVRMDHRVMRRCPYAVLPLNMKFKVLHSFLRAPGEAPAPALAARRLLAAGQQ